MATSLPDPRFQTVYAADYRGVLYHRQRRMRIPLVTKERWCEPGYQPKRLDKGVMLTVNDYPFHYIHYGGPNWSKVVYTDEPDYNEISTYQLRDA